MNLPVPGKAAVRAALNRLGFQLLRVSAEEESYLRGYDTSVPLPSDADEHLRADHPRLLDLERRYAEIDSPLCQHTQWRDVQRRTKDIRYFRGDNEYLWQYLQWQPVSAATPSQMRLRYYVYAQYVRDLDHRRLLGNRLLEDGQFGCFSFRYPHMATVSRDLLDSVNEIYFLDRHWDLFGRKGSRILDIGAGYGRLAHRMLTATDSVGRYYCVDAISRSTYLSEYYLRFRKLLDCEGARAEVIPLDVLATSLAAGSIDLAINIHSFSEMSRTAIAAWMRIVAGLAVPWLFVIPNEREMLSREHDGVRHEYRALIEGAGYHLEVTEPTIRDDDVPELYGACDHFFLFRRVDVDHGQRVVRATPNRRTGRGHA